MADKIIGLASLALSGATWVFIEHDDTASFYAVVFFVIGVYEFMRGEIARRFRQ